MESGKCVWVDWWELDRELTEEIFSARAQEEGKGMRKYWEGEKVWKLTLTTQRSFTQKVPISKCMKEKKKKKSSSFPWTRHPVKMSMPQRSFTFFFSKEISNAYELKINRRMIAPHKLCSLCTCITWISYILSPAFHSCLRNRLVGLKFIGLRRKRNQCYFR